MSSLDSNVDRGSQAAPVDTNKPAPSAIPAHIRVVTTAELPALIQEHATMGVEVIDARTLDDEAAERTYRAASRAVLLISADSVAALEHLNVIVVQEPHLAEDPEPSQPTAPEEAPEPAVATDAQPDELPQPRTKGNKPHAAKPRAMVKEDTIMAIIDSSYSNAGGQDAD